MFGKKVGALLLALLLLLTGCSGEAALVRDSVVASLDQTNYDFQGTLKLTGDLATWLEQRGDLDESAQALLKALESGVTIKGSSLDLNRSRFVLELNDDQVLRDNGLWTGNQKASAELLLDLGKVYVTTPLDQKYLLADTTADEDLDPEVVKGFQKKLNDLTISFMKKYFSTYGFKLSQAKNLGKATVELPNGQKAEATRIAIQFDLNELLRMLLYTVKDATESKQVRDYLVDVTLLIRSFAAEIDPESAEDEPFDRTQAEEVVDTVLKEVKAQLKFLEETYTIDQLAEKARELGLSGLSLKLEYYIGADKKPLRTVTDLSVTLQDPEDAQAKPVTIGIQADQMSWNFGKATSFTYPSAANTVSVEQLRQDKTAIEAFHENGFLRAFIREMNKEVGVIVLDLEENEVFRNGELVEGVQPYVTNGTTMVPLRFLAESMGATVSYNDATKTAVLEKGGNRIEVTVNSSVVRVNGETRTMPVPAAVKNGSMYVPLRFVSSELGADVTWLPEFKQVFISYEIVPY